MEIARQGRSEAMRNRRTKKASQGWLATEIGRQLSMAATGTNGSGQAAAYGEGYHMAPSTSGMQVKSTWHMLMPLRSMTE